MLTPSLWSCLAAADRLSPLPQPTTRSTPQHPAVAHHTGSAPLARRARHSPRTPPNAEIRPTAMQSKTDSYTSILQCLCQRKEDSCFLDRLAQRPGRLTPGPTAPARREPTPLSAGSAESPRIVDAVFTAQRNNYAIPTCPPVLFTATEARLVHGLLRGDGVGRMKRAGLRRWRVRVRSAGGLRDA